MILSSTRCTCMLTLIGTHFDRPESDRHSNLFHLLSQRWRCDKVHVLDRVPLDLSCDSGLCYSRGDIENPSLEIRPLW